MTEPLTTPLTLAVVADIHHGRDHGTKLGSQAEALFRTFAGFVAEAAPDLVVDLGDRINDVRGAEEDRALEREVAGWFAALPQPRAHILGNHDVNSLSEAENAEILGAGDGSFSMDVKGVHLAFWNAGVRHSSETGFVLGQHDLDWLAADLAATDLPTVICSHVPLDQGSMLGNYYFEASPRGRAHYANGEAARAVIQDSGRVVLCLAGHTHWNAYNCIDGTHYVTIHSLTESFTTHPHATGAFARVQVGRSIEIEVLGRDPARYSLPIRALGHRWLRRSAA